jgi:hypothetical protein
LARVALEDRGRVLHSYHHKLAFAPADLPKDGTGQNRAMAAAISSLPLVVRLHN